MGKPTKQMYFIRRIGSFKNDMFDEDTAYETKKAAIRAVEKEMEAIIGDDYDGFSGYGIFDNYGNLYEIDGEKYYSWKILEKREYSRIEKILQALDDAMDGLQQYSFELSDTGCCFPFIYKAELLVEEIRDSQRTSTDEECPVTSEDITGFLGTILARDMSDLPPDTVKAIESAYKVCAESLKISTPAEKKIAVSFFAPFCGNTNTELIDDALEKELDIFAIFRKKFESDSDSKSERVLRLYRNADETKRAIMDSLLVELCGWPLRSLIEFGTDRRSNETNK